MNYDDAKKCLCPFMRIFCTCIALVAAVMFFGCKPPVENENKTPAAQYKVTLEKTAGGNVTVTPVLPDSGMVNKNTELTFTATKLSGYKFVKWEHNGADTSVTEPTYKLTVTQPVRIKAVFEVDGTPITKHTVTLTPPVNGTVTSVPEIPSDKQVAAGTEITFTATAQSGYAVEKWTVSPNTALKTGGAAGSQTATITITADTTVKVKFKPTLTDQEKVEKAKEALQLSFQNGDTADNISSTWLSLPMKGLHNTKISWKSSTDTIKIKKENERSYGSIARPEENTQVTLTATITKGDASATKSFTVTVRGTNKDAVISAAEQAVRSIPSFVTKDTSSIQLSSKETVSVSNGSSNSSVEVNIKWKAEPAGVISVSDGTVRPHETEIKKVRLTATAKKGSAESSKTIEVAVCPKNNEPDLQTVVESIVNTLPADIDADIQLPQSPSGYKLIWSSSKDSILKIAGNSGHIETWDLVDRTVELTATLEKNADSKTATKKITIKARKKFKNGNTGGIYEFDGKTLTLRYENGAPVAVHHIDIASEAKTIKATFKQLTDRNDRLLTLEEIEAVFHTQQEQSLSMVDIYHALLQKDTLTLKDIPRQLWPNSADTEEKLFDQMFKTQLSGMSYEQFLKKTPKEQTELLKKVLKLEQNSMYKMLGFDENTPLEEAKEKMRSASQQYMDTLLERAKKKHVYQYRIEGDALYINEQYSTDTPWYQQPGKYSVHTETSEIIKAVSLEGSVIFGSPLAAHIAIEKANNLWMSFLAPKYDRSSDFKAKRSDPGMPDEEITVTITKEDKDAHTLSVRISGAVSFENVLTFSGKPIPGWWTQL